LVDTKLAVKIVYVRLSCIDSLGLPGIDNAAGNGFDMFRAGFKLFEGGVHLLCGQSVQVLVVYHHRLDWFSSSTPVTCIKVDQLFHRLEGIILKVHSRCFPA